MFREAVDSGNAFGMRRTMLLDGVRVPLDTVTAPGAYVCNWSGHLLRVPEQSLCAGVLTVNMVGGEPLIVTKISDDPDLPIAQARGRAWSLGLSVGF